MNPKDLKGTATSPGIHLFGVVEKEKRMGQKQHLKR
jgi:hypothetical protein